MVLSEVAAILREAPLVSPVTQMPERRSSGRPLMMQAFQSLLEAATSAEERGADDPVSPLQ